jgi:hypothetical protein
MALSVIDSTGLSNPFGAPAAGNVMATWTTSARPASPTTGQYGYNTTYGGVEVYNGSAWDLITGGPAFSAYCSTGTTLSSSAFTKLIYDTKYYDTNGCYNNTGSTVTLNGISTPSYSFAPNVPGYYLFTVTNNVNGSPTNTVVEIQKNSSTQSLYGSGIQNGSNIPYFQTAGMLYLNGTSDYVSANMYVNTSGCTSGASTVFVFQGSLIRGA